ncbi:MAG: ribosome maturation factor RimP [Candidatus Liberibacter europaeus]|uniref:Ribosome maturation factor RimP n=1 Tax=Candidatus Liberibacter europaeus TaxID=744859 RepID=A0A2T4VZ93_9HYPH|nr:ribosome maturation factor RimP [Candidatus Liberibacter europaeus]PTL87096.1 MAG: ribosome maturation factor RimP [Candidatus Liberibacter europaeus]
MESTRVFCSKYEPRLFKDEGLCLGISDVIQPVIEEMGFKIIRISLQGKDSLLLQVLVERDDGTMTLHDCEGVSRAISPILDVENLIDKRYTLEVSSPGVDRPMVRKSDFIRWVSHVVECEIVSSSGDREKLIGKILETSDTGFFLEVKKKGIKGVGLSRVAISFNSLLAAKLVVTKELLRATLADN